jgi:hypothetical protein
LASINCELSNLYVFDANQNTEFLAESATGWEDAAQQAVTNAARTLRNVRSIYIDNFEATVDQGKIKSYRINAKISFLLDES